MRLASSFYVSRLRALLNRTGESETGVGEIIVLSEIRFFSCSLYSTYKPVSFGSC